MLSVLESDVVLGKVKGRKVEVGGRGGREAGCLLTRVVGEGLPGKMTFEQSSLKGKDVRE